MITKTCNRKNVGSNITVLNVSGNVYYKQYDSSGMSDVRQ